MELKERITKMLERWFIQEPALFQILCSHELKENTGMKCPVRSGKRRVEYNPLFLDNMTDEGMEEAMRTEAIRLLMKHPYERRPDQCSDKATAIGSNMTISDCYTYRRLNIEKPSDFDLDSGMPYEWYARRIQELLPESETSADLAELWEEDDLAVTMINGIINSVKDWGSLAGAMAEQLKASTRARINWRNIFSGFRASVLSSERRLTRMRPNRRSGFEQMGSTRQFTTKLLVAVDVSGSISSESLSYFYGVINSAFRYGFESIDVVQFDCGVRVVQNLQRVMRDVTVIGRGGTDFQQPVDYAFSEGYDGLIILTDGYAPEPVIPKNGRTKILWVCEDQYAYEAHHQWMEKTGRVCTIDLR